MKQIKKHILTVFGCLVALNGNAAQQAPVALGTTSTFVALAGSTVTVTGGGSVTGNIGISPGLAFVPGVPPVTVNGTVYSGGPIAAQAQVDLNTAFNDAAGRQLPVSVAGNIGGQTLVAGLYKSTSSLAVSSGDLTLDGQGDPNAVFIFQIASTLTMTSGRQVILSGGARSSNIFWQVGSSATIGTTAVIHGTILANISISVLTGAVLDGRALAQAGAVTFDTGGLNGIAIPVVPVPPAAPVIFPAGTTGNATGTVNEASYVSPVAAGSIVAVFGNGLAVGQSGSAPPPPLPVSLSQSSFNIGGFFAPFYFASSGQVNLQIPWELAGLAQATITATVAGSSSNTQRVNLATFAPGIYTTNMLGSGQGAIVNALTGQVAGTVAPALRGTYVSIYCTGLGPVTNRPATGAPAQSVPLSITTTQPTVTIGGVGAVVSYSGLAPTLVGLYQVNVQVPINIAVGAAVPVVMSIGGSTSNTVTVAVQ